MISERLELVEMISLRSLQQMHRYMTMTLETPIISVRHGTFQKRNNSIDYSGQDGCLSCGLFKNMGKGGA